MSGTELEPVEVVDAELVVEEPGGSAVAVYDPATLAVLAALDDKADEHLAGLQPHNTTRGYANDWALWTEFHAWLAERTGHVLPLTAVTRGTLVGFVTWLDQVKQAAPSSIDRRITGVTVTARRPPYNVVVPKEATLAARRALKPLRLDEERQARGRGPAKAATPAHLKRMAVTAADDLTGLRDRALFLTAFFIAGRSAEVAALNVAHFVLESEGLRVKVPSVKGRPSRKVAIAYGSTPDACPVRAWLTWKAAAGLTSGPAFLPIDRWGHMGEQRLSPAACRDVISRRAARAGVEVRLTGHSARAGFITTSRRAGKREEKIREQSGHAPNSPVFWRYIRDADAWVDAASEGLL